MTRDGGRWEKRWWEAALWVGEGVCAVCRGPRMLSLHRLVSYMRSIFPSPLLPHFSPPLLYERQFPPVSRVTVSGPGPSVRSQTRGCGRSSTKLRHILLTGFVQLLRALMGTMVCSVLSNASMKELRRESASIDAAVRKASATLRRVRTPPSSRSSLAWPRC